MQYTSISAIYLHSTISVVYTSNYMSNVIVQPVFVTTQPMVADPFYQLTDDWKVGLCNICDDCSQCEKVVFYNIIFFFIIINLLVCYAYWCWPCFVLSLSSKVNESCLSCWCLPNALAAYRMKVRTAYRIKVRYSKKSYQ